MGAYIEASTMVLFGCWVYAKANSEMDVTGLEQAKGLGWPVVPEVVMVDGQPYVLQFRFGQQDQASTTAVPAKAEHLQDPEHEDSEFGDKAQVEQAGSKPRPTSASDFKLQSRSPAGTGPAPTRRPREVKKVLKAKAKTCAGGAAAGGRQQTLAECGLGSGPAPKAAVLPIGARQHCGPAVPPTSTAPSVIGAACPPRKPRVVAAQKHALRAHLGRKYSAIMGIGAGRLTTLG
jgi:hypothetical protein